MPPGSEDTLTVDGLSLPLERAPDGVRVTGDRGELEALTLALNSGAGDWLPGMRDAIARGEDAARYPVVVMRPAPGVDYGRAAEVWRKHAGSEPGEDVYAVGSAFSPDVIVPRTALLALLDRLIELRGGPLAAPPPPPRPAPALTEHDRPYFEELEQKAREVDALRVGPRDEEAIAQEHAKRRSLLLALDANGLLAGAGGDAPALDLKDWHLYTLAGYRRAALALLAYLDSEERRERLPAAAAGRVLGAPVSLDWFRLNVAPQQGLSSHAWLAWAEAQFAASNLQPGSEGAVLVRHGGPWYRLRWRKDDGVTPALIAAETA
jgi:hypothetical protein